MAADGGEACGSVRHRTVIHSIAVGPPGTVTYAKGEISFAVPTAVCALPSSRLTLGFPYNKPGESNFYSISRHLDKIAFALEIHTWQ